MNIHEFQAKALLRDYGVTVPSGQVADSAAAAEAAAKDLGGGRWAIKAQVHAGARGKAGGVRLVDSPSAVATAAGEMLGQRLVTSQTGPEGKAVRQVYVEQAVDYTREVYLAVLVDRALGRVALIGAPEGGADIEARVAQDPTAIKRLPINPAQGLSSGEAEGFAAELGFTGAAQQQAAGVMEGAYRAFVELDASLIEFNPLVETAAGDLLAVDIKMSLDDNALFRHADLESLRDQEEVDPSEVEAQRFELNYVKLGGNIGCMVNGAGLALATIDILKQQGGAPADFMDVRPTATRDQVAAGFKMLLDNVKVKAILVNVYGGGILRCDTIGEGIAAVCRGRKLTVPLIVRAAGTNRELCQQILTSQGIPVIFARDMADAARRAVAAVEQEVA